MFLLNPLEIAILGLLGGVLYTRTDLEETLCPEFDRDELLAAVRRLLDRRLITDFPGRRLDERYYMITAGGLQKRDAQRQQQIALFQEKEAAVHAA
jgi:hypothetical protein